MGTMTVVIPTYKEKDNIVRMAEAIRSEYPDYKILFMDDNSNDGSKELIEGLNDPLTKIIVRKPEEKGLAASVLQGFLEADTDYAMCMDCDFQHPITALKQLKDCMDTGVDLCVGVRYNRRVMGFKRTMGSWMVELFCKVFFVLHGKKITKDMMSGLFAIKCSYFQSIIRDNWSQFELEGWKVLMDLCKFSDKDFKIGYIKYYFNSREVGESHLNPKVPIMTFHQLWGFGKWLSKFLCKLYKVDYYKMYPDEM
jgi:dolichol-phosphate mannosyltransferase